MAPIYISYLLFGLFIGTCYELVQPFLKEHVTQMGRGKSVVHKFYHHMMNPKLLMPIYRSDLNSHIVFLHDFEFISLF